MNAPVLALERYADALTSLAAYRAIVAQGPLTGQSAAVLRTGLEQIDSLLAEGRSLGLEAYGTSARDARTTVTVAVEALDEKVQGLVTKAKEWFAKVLEWLKGIRGKLANAFHAAIAKGTHVVEQLKDLVQGITDETPKEAKLTLENPNYLVSGKTFIGHDLDLERKILTWVTTQHGPKVVQLLQDAQTLLRTYRYTDGSAEDFQAEAEALWVKHSVGQVSYDLGYLTFTTADASLTIQQTSTENGKDPVTFPVRPIKDLAKFSQDCLALLQEVSTTTSEAEVQVELDKIHELENNTSSTIEEAQLRMQCEVRLLGLLQGVVHNGQAALINALISSLENKMFLCRREASQYSQKAQQHLRTA